MMVNRFIVSSAGIKKVFILVLLIGCSAPQSWPQAGMDMGPVYGDEESGHPSAYGSSIADDVVIETDPETGSLIIVTDEETNEYIRRILENIDAPVPQVLIKVLFLEVTLSDDLDIGAQGSFSYGSSGSKDVLEILYGLAGETSGGFYRIIDEDLSVTLHALETVGSLEVLSRPSVLAKQNEQAVVTIGQEVPFVRNSRVTSDGQTINTVEYEDIGIILTVTPFITPDGLVDMQLSPEISTLTSETVPISDTIDAPIFAKRAAETVVVVPDGKTVVIGGLMEDNKTEKLSKVPILSSIPILGKVFQRNEVKNSKTELLIFVTPHIVRGGDQLDTLSCFERSKSESALRSLQTRRADKFLDDTGGSIQPQELSQWPEEIPER